MNLLKTCVFLLLVGISAAHAKVPLPNYDSHKAFLIQRWDPAKPSIIAFKDPRCPYCIKALEMRERLDNYNVFLFWAPILGQGSVDQVERFFHCKSPSEQQVLDAVAARRYPMCASGKNDALRIINDNMVASYNPNSVPQYWYGGRRVGLSQLNLALPKVERLQLLAENSRLKIQWDRYTSHAVNPPVKDALAIGVVLPKNVSLSGSAEIIMSQDSEINWYVFDGQSMSSPRGMEFRLLTNLSDVTETKLVVGGKILSEKERKTLIDKQLQAYLFKI